MKRYFYIGIIVILLMALAIVGYGAWLNYSDENQIAKRMDSRILTLSGAKAAVRELYPTLKLAAVRFSSENMTDAVALTDGRILRWYVGKNSTVTQGETILSMANEQIPLKVQQANSAVSKAEAMLAQANSAYQRQGRLMAKDATSQEKYEESKAQYLAAQEALREAQVQRDQCLVQESWLSVTSPMDGEVLIIYQREGAYVQAGTPVALVGNFNHMTFSVNLADGDAQHLEVGEMATLSFPDHRNIGKAYDTEFGAGNQGWNHGVKVTLKDVVPPLTEPADVRRTVWDVDNRTRIFEPITYTGGILKSVKGHPCLTVPIEALFDTSHDKVFVVDEDGILHGRDVVAGADDGKWIEIYEGLSAGDVVVVGSLEGLADGMKVEVVLDEEA